jgi:hypothetical protein
VTDNSTAQQRISLLFSRSASSPTRVYRVSSSRRVLGNSPPPLVGCVHYTSVNGERRRRFEPRPGPIRAITSVGASMWQKQLAQATPKEWTEDPYFLCHLLALAQLQERRLDFPRPITFTVCSWPAQPISVCRTSVDSLPAASPRDERIRSGIHLLIRGRNYHRAAERAQVSEGYNNARAVYNSAKKHPVSQVDSSPI